MELNPSSRKQRKKQSEQIRVDSVDIFIEPKYNPESVSAYYYSSVESGQNKRILIENAKGHLSAIGWTFFYVWKTSSKKELRYSSPSGRRYISLKTACKASLDELPMNPDDHCSAPIVHKNSIGNGHGFVNIGTTDEKEKESNQLAMNLDDIYFPANFDGFEIPMDLDFDYECSNFFDDLNGGARDLGKIGCGTSDYMAEFDAYVQGIKLPMNIHDNQSTIDQEISPSAPEKQGKVGE